MTEKIKKILIKYEKEINLHYKSYSSISNEEWYNNMANLNFPSKNTGKAPILQYMEKIWKEAQKERDEEIKNLIKTYEEDLKAGNSTLPTHWIIKELKKLIAK